MRALVEKENILLTWTEIVRGMLVRTLTALVLANGMEVSTGREVGAHEKVYSTLVRAARWVNSQN